MKLKPVYFINEHHGIHIPKIFANFFDNCELKLEGVTEETLKILKAGPDEETYWDAWNEVEEDGIVVDTMLGIRYRVFQNGDCWLIPVGMEWDEKTELWVWPDK
jgi:hypothetical protein